MQNSGLGNAVNPLASLSIPYEIPVLMIVSWRGEPGKKDAVHHYPMGEATPGLFELLGVPTTVIREDTDLDQVVREAVEFMKKERKPAALIVPRGVFSKGAGGGERPAPILSGEARGAEPAVPFMGGELPSRTQVLEAWMGRFPEELAVSTRGFMSREVASLEKVDRHFPMQGSMGFAPAIALGLCRVLSDRQVHVLDGDGGFDHAHGKFGDDWRSGPSVILFTWWWTMGPTHRQGGNSRFPQVWILLVSLGPAAIELQRIVRGAMGWKRPWNGRPRNRVEGPSCFMLRWMKPRLQAWNAPVSRQRKSLRPFGRRWGALNDGESAFFSRHTGGWNGHAFA